MKKRKYQLFACIVSILALLCAVTLLAIAGNQAPLPSTESSQSGAALLIYGENQSAGQYQLLQTGLTAAGFASQPWRLADLQENYTENLQTALTNLAKTAGCTLNQIWLVTYGDTTPAIWRMGSQLQIAGMIMIAPQNLDGLIAGDLQQWPEGRPAALFCPKTASPADQSSISGFYERLTGEDATLFPAYQTKGIMAPRQVISSSGTALLNIYPVLPPAASLLSTRVLADVTDWLSDWSANPDAAELRYLARLRLLDRFTSLALAGLLLFLVPLGLALCLKGKNVRLTGQNDFNRHQQSSSRGWLAEGLLWIPSAILSAGVGLLIAWLAGQPGNWLLPALSFLPGCQGWLLILIRFFRNRWLDDTDLEKSTAAETEKVLLSAYLTMFAGLAALCITIICALGWSRSVFGQIKPPTWPWLILPALIILNWSAGFVRQSNPTNSDGLKRQKKWHEAFSLYLPFLLLLIWSLPALGWAGFFAALLLLAVQIWTVCLGKAAGLLTDRPGVAGLFQAAGFAMGFLMPPILAGLQLIH